MYFFLNLIIGIVLNNDKQYSVPHISCHCICRSVALIEYIGYLVHVFILAVLSNGYNFKWKKEVTIIRISFFHFQLTMSILQKFYVWIVLSRYFAHVQTILILTF